MPTPFFLERNIHKFTSVMSVNFFLLIKVQSCIPLHMVSHDFEAKGINEAAFYP